MASIGLTIIANDLDIFVGIKFMPVIVDESFIQEFMSKLDKALKDDPLTRDEIEAIAMKMGLGRDQARKFVSSHLRQAKRKGELTSARYGKCSLWSRVRK